MANVPSPSQPPPPQTVVRKGRGFVNTRRGDTLSTLEANMAALRVDETCAKTNIKDHSSSNNADVYKDNNDDEAESKAQDTKKSLPFLRPASDFPFVPQPTVRVTDCPLHFTYEHMRDAFKQYEFERGGFRLIWEGESDAILLFENIDATMYLLRTFDSSKIRIEPYKPTIDEIEKWEIATPKVRPPTNAAIAGRLLAGALGIKAPVQSESEKRSHKQIIDSAKAARNEKRALEEKKRAMNAAAFDE